MEGQFPAFNGNGEPGRASLINYFTPTTGHCY